MIDKIFWIIWIGLIIYGVYIKNVQETACILSSKNIFY